MTPTEDTNHRPERVPFLFKWIKRTMILLLLMVALFIGLLQFTVVQSWIGKQITNYLSELTGMEVKTEKVAISIFNGIELRSFSVIDMANDYDHQQGNVAHLDSDTILSGGILRVSLRKNLLYLFNRQLDLSYLGLKDFDLNIITNQGERMSNFDRFLSRLKGKKNSTKTKSANSFDILLKEIELSNINIKLDNHNIGKMTSISLSSGTLSIGLIDWECMDFVVNYLLLDHPTFVLRNYIHNDYCLEADDIIKSNLPDVVSSEPSPFSFAINELVIINGKFEKIDEYRIKREPPKNLDYSNFYFDKIALDVQAFKYDSNIGANIEKIALTFVDNTGFEVKEVTMDSIIVTNNKLTIPNYSIELNRSLIRRSLTIAYPTLIDLISFSNELVYNATFTDSKIYLSDFEHFVTGLGRNSIFRNNEDELLTLNGRYYGRISNLAGRDVDIKLGNKLWLAGSFNTRELLDPDNTVLNIKIDKFQTSMGKLKMLIPNFKVPDNFYKLGSINFKGRFDGYLTDFVAYGNLNSDVGKAELDMRLDISSGVNLAEYSGQLNLRQFNLGRWSDNKDLGLVDFNSKVERGKGLTLNTVNADISASVKSLFFKKYNYKDFTLKGIINKNTFDGNFKIEDPNLNFVFDGSFEYLNKKAFLNFSADIKQIDLQALNLSDSPLSFRGNLNINTSGNNINEITGNVLVKDFVMFKNDTTYKMSQLTLNARENVESGRSLMIKSDLGDVNIEGNYDLPNIVVSAKKILFNNYPYYTKTWAKSLVNYTKPQLFDFNINLNSSSNFLDLIGLKNTDFEKLNLKGRIDTYRNEISVASTIPKLNLKQNQFKDIQILVTSNPKSGDVLIHVDSTYALGRKFNPIDLQGVINNEVITFNFATEKLIDSLENFDIRGKLIPDPKGYNLNIQDNKLVMLGREWKIDPLNKIVFGTKYINISNLNITDGIRSLELNDYNENKGLSLDLLNFDLDLINDFWVYDKMKFSGSTNISAKVSDLYTSDRVIEGYVNVPSFVINGDGYGSLFIDVQKGESPTITANVSVGDFLGVKVKYNSDDKTLDAKTKLRGAPLYLLQYILKDGINNTSGYVNGDITIIGPISNLNLSGEARAFKGVTTLKYTGVSYYFDNQKFILTNKEINLNGAVLTDQNGNSGTVRGGLTHDLFRNFGVNASITGSNVVILNTTKADNPNYYGYGVGQVVATFTGNFDNVDMRINATTGPGSKLFIPVGSSQAAINQNFIKFVKKVDANESRKDKTFTVKGLDIEMTLILTPDAEVSIIFNESRNDIIKGSGRGNMKINISRQGDFDIFGDYEIERGEYLFTLNVLPVAKPFEVQRGSLIRWTGDPINATLDITANYRTRSSIRPFIEEFLTAANPASQRLAEQRSEVDLQLKLGGSLFKPDISFDLSFPNLTGDIASYTDSKLRTIRNTEQELNSQVLGLIVFNSFLPSSRVSEVFGTSGLQSASINTLSEFLSSQLSIYITSLINTALDDDGIISGIDFELGLRNNNFGLAANNNLFPDEIEVRLKNRFRFLDERFSLNFGGNYVVQNRGVAINQVLPDFSLEFILTDDKKLNARLYGRYDIDPINVTTLRARYGLGLGYRTEFGSMLDFVPNGNSIKQDSIQSK